MTQLVSPDRGCIEVDVGATRYRGNRIEVTDQQHARLLKAAGYIDPGPGGVTHAAGYRCPACGFGAFFTTCGRCGTPTEREAPPGP